MNTISTCDISNTQMAMPASEQKQYQQQIPVVKQISKFKYRRTGSIKKRHPQDYKSSMDCQSQGGGWEEDDQFNEKLDRRQQTNELVKLQCFAMKLENIIAFAHRELARLSSEL